MSDSLKSFHLPISLVPNISVTRFACQTLCRITDSRNPLFIWNRQPGSSWICGEAWCCGHASKNTWPKGKHAAVRQGQLENITGGRWKEMRGRQERWLHTGCDGKQPLSLRVTGRTSVFPGCGRYKEFNVSEDKKIGSCFIYNKHGRSERNDFPTKSFRLSQFLTCWKTGDDVSLVLASLRWLEGWAWDPWPGWDPHCLKEEAGNIHIVTYSILRLLYVLSFWLSALSTDYVGNLVCDI